MTGIAADRVNRSGKPLGATAAFAWAAVSTFVGYRNSRSSSRSTASARNWCRTT